MTGADTVGEACKGSPPGIVLSSDGLDARSRSALTVNGPTVLSFSGGRTSAYMLRKLLDRHGGRLPGDCHVVFANTGKEAEKTLRFVRDCCVNWSVPIVWVEYLPDGEGWRQVTFETASRNGEPFEALVRKRNYLPNPVARFCTVELKILRVADYMHSLGHDEFEVLVGLRADEPKRVATLRADPSGGTFRSDRPSYAQMLAFTQAQADAFGHAAAEAEDGIECLGCTD